MTVGAPPAVDVFVGPEDVPAPAGTAHFSVRRGLVSTAFAYADAWYRSPRGSWAISPDLPAERRSVVAGLPGAFADGAPDRWGRNLIRRRINAESVAAGRTPPALTDLDFLLGVSDLTRQGALRYRLRGTAEFLAPHVEVPKLVRLPELLSASDRVALDDHGDDLAAIKVLLAAGTASLGGARPKASVRDGETLLMAKFPHPNDEWDVMAWEKTALDLAEACGIEAPPRRLVDVGGRRVLLLERFDRRGRERVPYVSGLTLVQGRDGDDHDYVEIAEALRTHGSQVTLDLAQMWRRMAFSVAIHNTDDHLRNHGFLWHRSGWTVSPVFDLNPNPHASEARTTSIGFRSDPSQEREALLEVAAEFRLDAAMAASVWDEVMLGVRGWRAAAASNGIGESEVRRFAPVLDRF